MSGKGWDIAKAFDELWECCEQIKGDGNCGAECPLHYLCIEDTTVVEFADLALPNTIKEFMEFADNPPTRPMTKGEQMAEEANLKRCDPDDWD